MSHSKICQDWNPYFKAGCDGWCGNQHLVEPVYVKYCTKMNGEYPPTQEARDAFDAALDHFDRHHHKRSIEILNALLVDYPLNPTYHKNIARFYERIGSPKASFHFRLAIAIEPHNHKVHLNYANYSSKTKDYKTAAHHFDKALRLNDMDSVIHGMYAKFLRDVEHNYEQSKYHFERSIELNPNDNRALYQYALFLHQIGNLKLSKYYFEQCIGMCEKRKQKPFVWHHYQYALLLKDLNEFTNACIEFEYCLSLDDRKSVIQFQYGLLLCENQQADKGLHYLYVAYMDDPHNKQYETAFNQYKNYRINDDQLSNKHININVLHEYSQSISTPSTDDSASSSSYSSAPNHLEVTSTRREPPPPPAPLPAVAQNTDVTVDATTVIATEVISETKESENKNNTSVEDSDMVRPSCEIEFERWLRNKIAINQSMGDTYLKAFQDLEYNDIRLLEHFDEQTLQNVISNKLHIKMFEKQILKFKNDTNKFEEWLKTIGVHNEYFDAFESHGILTFESFYYYMNNSHDIQNIIGNKNESDAVFIWNSTPKYSRRVEESQVQREGKSV